MNLFNFLLEYNVHFTIFDMKQSVKYLITYLQEYRIYLIMFEINVELILKHKFETLYNTKYYGGLDVQ